MDQEITDLTLSGIVVIVGNYGSGKTEVAINLAVDQKARHRAVQLADLDLVNLYFRTRQARDIMSTLGIPMVLPPRELLDADLPVLTPQINGLIRNPGELAILDVGGDKVGAKVLGALADVIEQTSHAVTMWQVVNPNRPGTESIDGCLAARAAIEAAARLPLSGWVGNAHLMGETTFDHILQGYELMTALTQASDLPLAFITMPWDLWQASDRSIFRCPVLPIRRQLVPPWEKASALGAPIEKE